jgi:hypothetical protein
MDLAIAMIRTKHDLKEKIKEIREVVPLPPYVINSILSEIQNELKDEEKELLTIMLLDQEQKEQEPHKPQKEEGEDNGEDDVLHND